MHNRRDSDTDLGPKENLAIYLKRYGVIGGLITVAPFFYPHIMEAITNTQRDSIVKPIERKIDKLNQEMLKNRALSVTNNSKSLMLANDWNILARHRIRSQSLDKVRDIKLIWSNYDRNNELERKRLWTITKNILYRNTAIYVNNMNNYRHPIVGEMGAYLASSFPMRKDKNREYRPDYSFLSVVYRIVIEEQSTDPEIMEENLIEYMKSIQDEYFTDTYKQLRQLELDNNIYREI